MTIRPKAAPARSAMPQPGTAPTDLAAWRAATRSRLLTARASLSTASREAAAAAIATQLDALLAQRFDSLQGLIISAWWPIKAELDLRFWLASLPARGATAALPIVAGPKTPLTFRAWTPETPMQRGIWNIPVPAVGAEITPQITLSPLLGWDSAGFRLGYGGGYFDRTLASVTPSPIAIGIGLASAQLPTIFPQPYDIPMDYILTETGPQHLHP
ncbi:hypothetical protein GCM10010873_14380 [Cypionkella aquatica]|uniref:5-formyltetrahydrofolate cyclo-ligase n=1 Tax=Cypionkella aquatica TaxID=1756042 RepID=A0AA37X071_9RHOB|nr:5-formyltetrahydrofolate cyclo-ligase [Cypionkella aquatica]GLS86464.1 hypothetical protein GCM10010873_14380 [Cypionkella aquatica]